MAAGAKSYPQITQITQMGIGEYRMEKPSFYHASQNVFLRNLCKLRINTG